MFNVYNIQFIETATMTLRPNINWRLTILYSGIKYGKILRFTHNMDVFIESPYLFKFVDNLSERLLLRNTFVSDTFEVEDRGFAMAGDDVIFMVNNSDANLYDWKKDLNNYQEFRMLNGTNDFENHFSIIYGKSTRSHSKKYQPFGIDKLGNPGDGIEGIKIFKQ